MFTWGENEKGQLGIDEREEYELVGFDEPKQVGLAIEGKVVTEIACGKEFSIVVLEDGKVSSYSVISKYLISLMFALLKHQLELINLI